MIGPRNTKTCQRRAGGNLHLKAAIDRVGILTVFSGEDTMQWTVLLPAQERLLANDPQQFRSSSPSTLAGDPRDREVALPRRGERRHRLRSSHPGASAARRSNHDDGGCRRLGREREKKLV